MIVVTVAAQLGAGGRPIAQRVAEVLGIPYLDNELVHQASLLAGVSEDALADIDERRPTLLGYIADLLARYPTAAELGIPTVSVEPPLSQESFRRMFEDVILDVGTKGPAVIIGRAGNIILKDKPWVLRLYLMAPLQFRIQKISEREDVAPEIAKRMALESDKNRNGYHKTYYKSDWQDPANYDLMLNTGRIGMETAVELIVSAAKSLST